MSRSTKLLTGACLIAALTLVSCVPALKSREVNKATPATYPSASADTTDAGAMPWGRFYTDPDLRALIDTALANNQELNILLQEIEVARNEARARKGEYLPFVDIGAETEGLVHVSEMADHRVNRPEDVVKVGDAVTVRCAADGKDGPFATLHHAQQVLRKIRETGKPAGPLTVIVHGGRYQLDEPLTFSPADSGTDNSPTRFIAAPGEHVILSGGVAVV